MQFTAQHFNYTLNMYKSINVHVYVVQQPPAQAIGVVIKDFYKRLLNKNELNDVNIRKWSVTRTKYDEQQKEFNVYFSKFNNTRGVTVIRIEDLVCDAEVCPFGTAAQPFYVDKLHMSSLGAQRLAQRIRKYVSF
jgi:hypothetical protein